MDTERYTGQEVAQMAQHRPSAERPPILFLPVNHRLQLLSPQAQGSIFHRM